MKSFTFVLIALQFTITANAQTIKKYSGQMSKPEWIAELFESSAPHNINGYYSYYENKDENRINHGAFQVNYKTGLCHFEIRGSFSHGKRDGKWTMREKLLNGKYSSTYLYQFNYTNGVLNGPFQICDPNNFGIEIMGQFANGVITGKVTIKVHEWLGTVYELGIQFEGRVNSMGKPHGIWTEKRISKNAVPKDISRLYYDGNIVYRREKDLSLGKVEYTKKISDKIKTPADSVLITDTIINGENYINVAGIICCKDTEAQSDLYDIVCTSRIAVFYPSIQNWQTSFDTESYLWIAKKEKEEEQRRLEEERMKKEEEERRQRMKKEEEESRLREEKLRKEGEIEVQLYAKYQAAWNANRNYYEFCWGMYDASSKFKKLFREVGLDSINTMLDSISRYEYENYTVEELFTNNPDYHYYIYNVFLSDIGKKKKKKLNKIFKSYDEYLKCKKQGVSSMQMRIQYGNSGLLNKIMMVPK